MKIRNPGLFWICNPSAAKELLICKFQVPASGFGPVKSAGQESGGEWGIISILISNQSPDKKYLENHYSQ
jgi:hypothetical protein